MDEVLSKTLKANLKNAKTPEAKLDAVVLAMISVVDCQQKTSGRVKWHGARVSRVTDVEAMEYISTYEDGTVFRDPAPKLRQAAAATNRLMKGVSARLAAARLRRLEEAQRTNTVDVVLTPDSVGFEPLPEEPPEPDADPHSSDQGSED